MDPAVRIVAPACFACLLWCCSGCDAFRNRHADSMSARPDETGMGLGGDSTVLTPIDQDQSNKDMTITADIRHRIVGTEMSADAHHVKIITRNGKVTLRGVVRSEEEKKKLDDIANEIAGAGHVESHLEIEHNYRNRLTPY
jgi:osmotically-inducible protein OsmY